MSRTQAEIKAACDAYETETEDVVYVNGIIAALETADRVRWQTMDTAPKEDEPAILIGNFRTEPACYRVAYYDHEADPTYPWHVEDAAKGFNHHRDWPTHWQFLPSPPEEK